MDKRHRMAVIAVAALSVLYAAFSGLGLAGIESSTGGVVRRLIIIAALLFSCSRAFTGANMRPALLAGALALGAFAVFELYSFAYIYLYGGEGTDITVGNYARNCAYLFLIVAATHLSPPVFRAHRTIRTVLGVISSLAVGLICYAIIDGNARLLTYSALAITAICLLAAASLFHSARGDGAARLFAVSIVVICLLDTASRLLVVGGMGDHLGDAILSVYPAAYLFIGYALIGLRRETANSE